MGHEPWAQDKNFGAQPPDQTIHGRPRVQNLDSGVKGHMLINQQRILSIINIICRVQNSLPNSIHCHYSDWNKNIYICSCYKVVISPAGSRAMIRARASTRAKMHMHVHYLCISCMLDQYPTIFGVVTLYVDILSLP